MISYTNAAIARRIQISASMGSQTFRPCFRRKQKQHLFCLGNVCLLLKSIVATVSIFTSNRFKFWHKTESPPSKKLFRVHRLRMNCTTLSSRLPPQPCCSVEGHVEVNDDESTAVQKSHETKHRRWWNEKKNWMRAIFLFFSEITRGDWNERH